MKNKKIWIGLLIIAVISVVVYFIFFRKKSEEKTITTSTTTSSGLANIFNQNGFGSFLGQILNSPRPSGQSGEVPDDKAGLRWV